MNVKNVSKWCREFAAGRTEVHDVERSGRPSLSDETAAKVEQTMREDRRITLDDLCILVPEVSRSTIHRILTEKLQYRKACAKWVPRMLTEDHQRQRNRRRGMLSKGVSIFHDNARPHVACTTVALLQQFGWDIVTHPPYSPDLAPSDYHLFPKLKEHLAGTRFNNDDEVKDEVQRFLNGMAASWYDMGIQKLLQRLQKCIDRNGDYVEK
ncbi:Histone-lysine N-methyltransferase SETMAR [Dufourea novaeangliae]|uniref:Histone-lysine N-methyltransferase SETMAR n=1 Tax=Dufourea novaeangliae TaxID=178035 RepID=A0A154PI31_DUFNO|nr:Histone-lysine N-methyltransferase SETMAR [Dufourea novaeangliae]